MKIYFYIRLSNADKDLRYKTESDSIANQRSLLQQYLQDKKEFNTCEIEEYIDDGYSGTDDHRPAFERMIQNLKNSCCKVVVCKDFSRFFRDYVEIGDYLERIFPFLGVRFISVNDHYDSDDYKGTTGGMEVVMKTIVYSYYSRDLSQKIKTVLREKAKKGQFIGSAAPYGYERDPNDRHHLIVDPIAAVIVREIFDMALAGKKTGEIARQLNDNGVEVPTRYFHRKFPENKRYGRESSGFCWDTSTIRDIIMRKEYMGALVSQKCIWKGLESPEKHRQKEENWIVIPNSHEAIVSKEEYEKAQKAIRHCKQQTERKPQSYLLRSLVRCGVCGRIMTRNGKKRVVKYSCQKSLNKSDTKCPRGEWFKEEDLERIVIDNFLQVMNQISEYSQQVQMKLLKSGREEEAKRQSLIKIEQLIKQNKLMKIAEYERYSEGEISRAEFIMRKNRLDAEMAILVSNQEKLEQNLSPYESVADSEFERVSEAARGVLKAKQITNEMLLFFIDRINVYSGMKVEIRYKFEDILTNIVGE